MDGFVLAVVQVEAVVGTDDLELALHVVLEAGLLEALDKHVQEIYQLFWAYGFYYGTARGKPEFEVYAC